MREEKDLCLSTGIDRGGLQHLNEQVMTDDVYVRMTAIGNKMKQTVGHILSLSIRAHRSNYYNFIAISIIIIYCRTKKRHNPPRNAHPPYIQSLQRIYMRGKKRTEGTSTLKCLCSGENEKGDEPI